MSDKQHRRLRQQLTGPGYGNNPDELPEPLRRACERARQPGDTNLDAVAFREGWIEDRDGELFITPAGQLAAGEGPALGPRS
jgi:hypothetical protein